MANRGFLFTFALLSLMAAAFLLINKPSKKDSPIRDIQQKHDIVNETQEWRQQLMKESCKLHKKLDVHIDKTRILVDDHYKTLYCMVAKAGNTMWKYKLFSLHSPTKIPPSYHNLHELLNNKKNRVGLRPLSTYSSSDMKKRNGTYFKYLIVRHPFSRLVSAFRNKFQQENEGLFFKIHSKILKTLRPESYKTEMKMHGKVKGPDFKNYNISFNEFIDYILTSGNKRFRSDKHWRPFVDVCRPCVIHYDYIMKLETFTMDAKYILANIYNTSNTELKAKDDHTTGTNLNIATKYLNQLPRESYQKIKKMYATDMNMFGYTYDQFN